MSTISNYKSRRVLLIGGAGYVGPVIAEELLRVGYSVRCLDLLLYNNGQSCISLIKTTDLNLFVETFQTSGCLKKLWKR